ncbi:DHA2 family efflux MFS transporter permease subunit [Streptomyces sp. NPDC051219]|uniref:DHA2 family efflux MFS transporter permease subunit n=1 Tax=Streptomyces sp. NPDC051219 TaxID=3155283 RepID=UPI00344926B8
MRYGLLVVMSAGASFLAFLDSTVANLAVPSLATDFPDAEVTDLTWVLTIYAIAFAALLAPAGRLADVIGRRSLYMTGMGLFTVSSLLCAIAPNVPLLLTFRGLQAAGAAAMIPASLAVILMDSPPERRLASIAKWAAAASAAAAVGPSLGGVLVEAFDWRAVFLINVPLGLALLFVARAIPRKSGQRSQVPDLVGTVFLGGGIGLLALGVTQGHDWEWSNAKTLACLIGGAALLAAALMRSSRHAAPAVEISLWKSRNFALANAISVGLGAALYAWLLVGVLYLNQVWGYSELKAGLAMSPGAVASAIVALTAGRVMAKTGPRPVILTGAALLAAAGVWLTVYLPTEPHFLALWLPAGLLSGIGLGAMSTGVSTAAAMAVEPVRFAGATGLNVAARQMGGALGLATMAVLVSAAADNSGTDAFSNVYLFCTVASVAAGLLALALAGPRKPAVPQQQARTSVPRESGETTATTR